MATFGQVVEITFLLLLWCIDQSNPNDYEPRTRKTRTTLSDAEYIKQEKIKSFHFEYYPNYGYEPYWADGEWMLSTTTVTGSTTKEPRICGEACNYLHRRIKHVCGRLSNHLGQPSAHSACGVVFYDWRSSLYCTGSHGDDYNHVYKNFDTYCDFLAAQCKAKFYEEKRWVLVNIGKCKHLDDYFKPLWLSDQPVSRKKFYLSSLFPPPTTVRR